MPSLWIIIPLVVIATAFVFAVGMYVGLHFQLAYDRFMNVKDRVDALEIAAEDEDESAVVETTPQLIREKERKGELDDDESQIVEAKSPRQVKADKERRLQEEIDRETGTHHG